MPTQILNSYLFFCNFMDILDAEYYHNLYFLNSENNIIENQDGRLAWRENLRHAV